MRIQARSSPNQSHFLPCTTVSLSNLSANLRRPPTIRLRPQTTRPAISPRPPCSIPPWPTWTGGAGDPPSCAILVGALWTTAWIPARHSSSACCSTMETLW
ncbi:hypothetical protein BCR44DRAFT_1426572 [Catenaria anguillulae PL171]|uniref:Uncharacterized protein n=1 Tax=Catenaria anguillulae PL171 TaxID=765915 RepID=A0A1Y2HXU7_9FUNG|nr:hypothetical protein BCR44DRAFT_1426572 [Catenaria anguillulae PL171]